VKIIETIVSNPLFNNNPTVLLRTTRFFVRKEELWVLVPDPNYPTWPSLSNWINSLTGKEATYLGCKEKLEDALRLVRLNSENN